MQIVVHGVAEVAEVVEIGRHETIRDLLILVRERGHEIDVETAVVAITDADDDLDREAVVVTVVREGSHLHVRHHDRCHHAELEVRFQGQVRNHSFKASKTVGRALAWSTEVFGIVSTQRSQYRLKLPIATEYLENDLHLGKLTAKGECAVRVDLVRFEQNAGASEVSALLDDLDGIPFRAGVASGRWGRACVNGSVILIPVSTSRPHPKWIGLRLDVTGYRATPPQGTFWDLEQDTRLADVLWPTLPDGNQAFRADWAGGHGLYIACDRSALVAGAGHPEWANTHPNTNWRPDIGIARYLKVVADLLEIAAIPAKAA